MMILLIIMKAIQATAPEVVLDVRSFIFNVLPEIGNVVPKHVVFAT
jgi:hypothetical protein